MVSLMLIFTLIVSIVAGSSIILLGLNCYYESYKNSNYNISNLIFGTIFLFLGSTIFVLSYNLYGHII